MSMSIIDSQEPAYMAEHEIDVLGKRIAELEADVRKRDELLAKMYSMLAETDMLEAECSKPTDDDCDGGCSDCGWYIQPLRDELLRMGVEI